MEHWHQAVESVGRVDDFVQMNTNLFNAGILKGFHPISLGDIKNIDHLIQIGTNLGKLDNEPEIVQCTGHFIKQPTPVNRKHLDDRAVL